MEVNISALMNASEEYRLYAARLRAAEEELEDIRFALWLTKHDDIRWYLRKLENQVERISNVNDEISKALRESAERYRSTERRVENEQRIDIMKLVFPAPRRPGIILMPRRPVPRLPWMRPGGRYRFNPHRHWDGPWHRPYGPWHRPPHPWFYQRPTLIYRLMPLSKPIQRIPNYINSIFR